MRRLVEAPPAFSPARRGALTVAVDPGFRHGHKCAVLDRNKVVAHFAVDAPAYGDGQERWRAAAADLDSRLAAFGGAVATFAVGDGANSRGARRLVAGSAAVRTGGAAYVVVRECGASAYSASPLGEAELPEVPLARRSAVSLGRRACDPTAGNGGTLPRTRETQAFRDRTKASTLGEPEEG